MHQHQFTLNKHSRNQHIANACVSSYLLAKYWVHLLNKCLLHDLLLKKNLWLSFTIFNSIFPAVKYSMKNPFYFGILLEIVNTFINGFNLQICMLFSVISTHLRFWINIYAYNQNFLVSYFSNVMSMWKILKKIIKGFHYFDFKEFSRLLSL